LNLSIDAYERFYQRPRKVVRRRGRRSRREELAIPVQQRTKLLIQSGYSIYEITEATLEVIRIKKERAETMERKSWERVDEFMESASRVLRTVVDAKPSFVGAKTA
jgi:hypothetical protein